MPRTTLDLDHSIVQALRRRARREGKSMGQIASEALARSLGEAQALAPPRLQWTSRDLGTPRLDLEDKEAVRAMLDARP